MHKCTLLVIGLLVDSAWVLCMQNGIAEHPDYGKGCADDPVLQVNNQADLDALLAIAISNMKASGYTVGEVGSGAGALTKQVCSFDRMEV